MPGVVLELYGHLGRDEYRHCGNVFIEREATFCETSVCILSSVQEDLLKEEVL